MYTSGTQTLLSAVIATGAGKHTTLQSPKATFQASGATSTGTGSATIYVEVSNNRTDWIKLGTITLTLGTASTSDGFASDAPWAFVRGNVNAISGTNATVTLTMGV